MRTNLDKWNHYANALRAMDLQFIYDEFNQIASPMYLYHITFTGHINTLRRIEVYYNHRIDGKKVEFKYKGKKPKRTDIARLAEHFEYADANHDTYYKPEDIVIQYENEEDHYKIGVNLSKILDENEAFFTLDKEYAEEYAALLKTKDGLRIAFDRIHKKDENFNYEAAGYRFIGWNPTSSIAYQEHRGGNHFEYEVSTKEGDHTVSCPACKIYWKYDSTG